MIKRFKGLLLIMLVTTAMFLVACGNADNYTANESSNTSGNTAANESSNTSGNTAGNESSNTSVTNGSGADSVGNKTAKNYEYYNVEYLISYSESDTDGDGVIDYTYTHEEGEGNRHMYVMFCAKSAGIHGPAVEYWMDCFAYDGESFYGSRPYDEPSGLIENMIAYDNQGNVTGGMLSEESYMDYSFDSPVIYDAMERTYHHFVRVSDKIYY